MSNTELPIAVVDPFQKFRKASLYTAKCVEKISDRVVIIYVSRNIEVEVGQFEYALDEVRSMRIQRYLFILISFG